MTRTRDRTPKPKNVSPERKIPEPVNAEEVQKNWNEMVTYILTDACEKAEEIDVRTEEEFKVSKNNFYNKMKHKIDNEYEKKIKRSTLEVYINNSQTFHKMNMKKLQMKQGYLDELKTVLAERITSDLKDKEHYSNILYLLIMEGLFQLMEKEVFIRCRKKDICLVSSLLPHCIGIYKQTAEEKVELHLDVIEHLPETCLGGIQLSVESEKICILNTLDNRLDQIMLKSVPAINNCIFEKKLHILQL